MPRTIAYREGGFTNCGIGYIKFSQEELAEMKDRVMTENEAIEELQTAIELAKMCTQNFERKREIQGYEMAIKALEEVQRWHTSEINPEIKNVFANTSTQICHNCDHKDEYIVELEAEMEQYQILEKRLTEMFGDQLSLETVVDEMEWLLKEPSNPHPVNAKILTYEDAKAWEEYKAIGTQEECRAATEKQTAKKIVRREATDEDIENELREFITRKGMIFQCPTCGCYIAVDGMKNCWDCGQKLDWSDEQ